MSYRYQKEWKLTNQTRPELLTVEEASDLLRCSTDAIYDACRRGEMPSIRIGRLIRIPYAQVLNSGAGTEARGSEFKALTALRGRNG